MHSNVFLRATFTVLSGVVKDKDGRLHFWGQKERGVFISRAQDTARLSSQRPHMQVIQRCNVEGIPEVAWGQAEDIV